MGGARSSTCHQRRRMQSSKARRCFQFARSDSYRRNHQRNVCTWQILLQSLKTPGDKFPTTRQNKPRSLIDVASGSLARSPVSLSPGDEVPHMFTRKPHPRLEEFAITCTKRLLQQNRHEGATALHRRRVRLLRCCGSVCAWSWTSSMTHSEPNAPLRERMRLTRFSRPTRRTVTLHRSGTCGQRQRQISKARQTSIGSAFVSRPRYLAVLSIIAWPKSARTVCKSPVPFKMWRAFVRRKDSRL